MQIQTKNSIIPLLYDNIEILQNAILDIEPSFPRPSNLSIGDTYKVSYIITEKVDANKKMKSIFQLQIFTYKNIVDVEKTFQAELKDKSNISIVLFEEIIGTRKPTIKIRTEEKVTSVYKKTNTLYISPNINRNYNWNEFINILENDRKRIDVGVDLGFFDLFNWLYFSFSNYSDEYDNNAQRLNTLPEPIKRKKATIKTI